MRLGSERFSWDRHHLEEHRLEEGRYYYKKCGFDFAFWAGRELKYSSANVTYESVEKMAEYLADISPHVTVETLEISPPYTQNELFGAFEARFHKIQSSSEYTALTEQGERPKIVVIVDALSSLPALLMPWERVVEFCKGQENVWTLVDAAHAIGQIVDINLSKTQPDFFVSVSFIFQPHITGVDLLNRTATNGCTQNEHVQFSTYR